MLGKQVFGKSEYLMEIGVDLEYPMDLLRESFPDRSDVALREEAAAYSTSGALQIAAKQLNEERLSWKKDAPK